LWGKSSLVGKNFKPLEIWKKYAKNIIGFPLKGGHYLPEENPAKVAKEILNFFK
jgi:haloacetate dehalogenase